MRTVPTVLILLIFACSGCDGPSPNAAPPSAAPGAGSTAYDAQKAQVEIDELQTRLQTAMEQGSSMDAVFADTRRYVEKYPDVVAGRVLLGQIALLHGDFALSREQFEKALEIDPRQAEVRLSAGSAALQLGDLDGAERHYTQAVSLDTGNARYRVHLADVYSKRQQYDKAQTTLLEALRLDSSSHRAHALLSEVFAKQNKLDMAIEQCDRAIALSDAEPRFQQAYVRSKAKLQLRANRPDDALVTLSRLPPAVQATMDVGRQLAECWAMQGRPQRAAAHFEQLTILEPTHADAMAEAARWMLKADRRDDARRMLDRLRAVRPTHEAIAELEKALGT